MSKPDRFWWEYVEEKERDPYSSRPYRTLRQWFVHDRKGLLSTFEVPDAHTAEHVVRALNSKENVLVRN